MIFVLFVLFVLFCIILIRGFSLRSWMAMLTIQQTPNKTNTSNKRKENLNQRQIALKRKIMVIQFLDHLWKTLNLNLR